MKNTLCITTSAAIAFIAMFAFSAERTASRDEFRKQYGAIADHNIFLRNRYRPAPTTRRYTPDPPRQPEQSWVLTGIVQEDGDYRAYIENLDSHSVIKFRVGDSVSRGKVTLIVMDGIEYEQRSGQHQWVELGRDLSGSMVVTAPSLFSTATTGSSTQPSTMPINPDDPNLTMEEKLKLKRLQELKGK